MTITLVSVVATAGMVGRATSSTHAAAIALEQMPTTLETRFALSAAPPALRDHATVYLLDVNRGYLVSRPGTSGVACLVSRTAWEQADFRNDIYVPVCYDAAGTKSFLKVIRDAAALRIQGMSPAGVKTAITTRYRNGTYSAPHKAGLSYMIAPIMRTWMLPDMNVHTMPMPHLMFYAPNTTNEDIGAVPAASLDFPFVFKEGLPEQSYMIQLLAEADKTQILVDEKSLLDDLCAYREVLCNSSKAP